MKIAMAQEVTSEYPRDAVVNEYWCWRGKYCHFPGPKICARDKRLNKVHKFEDECSMYKYNCEYHRDYTATHIKC